jgi:hypothetical protein
MHSAMLLRRSVVLSAVAISVAFAPAASRAQTAPALLAGLEPGPHAVGFRVVPLADPSRPSKPKTDAQGQPVTASRARELALHVWYPAAGDGAPMSMADYIELGEPVAGGTPASFSNQHRQLLARIFGGVTDDEWARYRAVPFAARRNAAPAAGRFPLLAGVLRPVSIVAMSEYLASHGYVVAFVQTPPQEAIDADGLVLEALRIGQHQRDLELAIAAARTESFVDPTALGAVGFSADGLAQLVLAMRHPDVDAVSQLETGYFAPIGTSSYQEVTAYDPAALRVPMFFAYSESLGRNTDMQMAEIEKMRYAPRYFIYLGEPRMEHWDFATEGMVFATVLDRRRDAKAGVVRAFQAAQRHQKTFLDAFVKRDAAARARLASAPDAPGGGAIVEVRERPAVVPAISRREFRPLLDSDPARALQVAREGLGRDPHAPLFEEGYLNSLGYEMLQRGQPARAVDVLTLNVEAHPESANAYDSLSEALETVGRPADALGWAEKGLSVLRNDRSVPAQQRTPLEDGLRARIARLRGR